MCYDPERGGVRKGGGEERKEGREEIERTGKREGDKETRKK